MGRQQQRRSQQRARQRQQTGRQRPGGQQRGRGQQRGIGPWTIAGGVGALLIVVLILIYAATRPSALSATPPSPTAESLAQPVDGVGCLANEALAYHIHQHLTLYDHGTRVSVPSEIGIPGGEQLASCYYWIHVHAATPNIIHVESPIKKTFTLGTFFDIWKATRASTIPRGDAYVTRLESAAAHGQVHAFYNGKPWHGSYRSIPLTAHAVVTVEIGAPVVPPRPFTDWRNL